MLTYVPRGLGKASSPGSAGESLFRSLNLRLWNLLSPPELALLIGMDPAFQLPRGCDRPASRMAEARRLIRCDAPPGGRLAQARRNRMMDIQAPPASAVTSAGTEAGNE